jgi:hypothetical protein
MESSSDGAHFEFSSTTASSNQNTAARAYAPLSPSSSSPCPSSAQLSFVKFVFYMLGTGFLLPWNSFISAESYFLSRFVKTSSCDPDADNGDNDNDIGGGSFMSWLGLFYNLAGVLALAFLLATEKVKEVRKHKELLQEQQRQQDCNVDEPELLNSHVDKTNSAQQQEGEEEEIMTYENTSSHNPLSVSTNRYNEQVTNHYTTIDHCNTIDHDAAPVEGGQGTNNERKAKSPQWNTSVVSLSIYLIIMIFTSSFVLIPTFNNNEQTIQTFKILTFTFIIVCGTTGAFTSSSIVSYANTYFPPLYGIQCFISGQAIGGLVISLLNLGLDYFLDEQNEDTFWNDQCNKNRTEIQHPFYHYTDRKQYHGRELLDDEVGTKHTSYCHEYEYNIDWGAFSYFVTCCFFLVVCIGFFIILDQSSVMFYFRHHRDDHVLQCTDHNDHNDHHDYNNDDEADMNAHNTGVNNNTTGTFDNALMLENEENDHVVTDETRIEQDTSSLLEPLLKQQLQKTEDEEKKDLTTSHVWSQIYCPTICIFVTFFITLVIFPSWTGTMESTLKCKQDSSRFRNDLFTPSIVVLFNIFDLTGRMSSGYVMDQFIRRSNAESDTRNNDQGESSETSISTYIVSKKMYLLSMIRLLFLPAFLLCRNSANSIHLFTSDWYTILISVLFAFSNGLFSTLSFIYAATLMSSTDDNEAAQRVASTLLNFAVGLGLLCGSLVSFVYDDFGSKLM